MHGAEPGPASGGAHPPITLARSALPSTSMRWLTGLLRGGSDELGWDDLVRRVVAAIGTLAHYAERGRVVFPSDVVVRIGVADGSLDVIRGFTEKLEFDREVETGLANQCDCAPSELPTREYLVSQADRTTITVTEGAPRAWEVCIDGGDLAGTVLVVPAGRTEVRFGRGDWHGPDEHVRNDLVVCRDTGFVSRRAGRLTHAGHQLHVEALDQGDTLLVRRRGGDVVRPARTASGKVAARAGDAIELGDGQGSAVRLIVRRTQMEGTESSGGRDA